ncbi:hypothetical protein GOA89_14770 [Sinorhizobium meliloti]|nr:hypothetical protein [Sinorhizobium meliloti]MDW9847559.1 hypothetical protein [Sinorhizobium meliloti]MDX0144058.1 hypothetical protein [Sinorhizobium meliloti]MDX0150483.1 hypothetical protein [Sinorhizobium meliloti]MDX0169737.1 hypothetical protein [Sinorhizobium meliloti]
MTMEFDWKIAREEGDVVVRSQSAIAVYANTNGDVVIREEQSIWGDEDTFIVIPREHATKIAEKVNAVLRESAGS